VYEEDHALLEKNFRAYINGFSKNVDDIIENFNYRAVIGQIVKNNRLAPILNQYKELEVGPDQLSNLRWGISTKSFSGDSQNRAARRPGSTLPLVR
jgi:type I restriction enzyme M protein